MTRPERFWDRIAPRYAARPVRDAAAYEHTLARTAAWLGAGDHVAEFGCGTGTTALRMAPFVARIDPIFQGLAISMLFGLASSTLLTVLVIPAIYRVLRT